MGAVEVATEAMLTEWGKWCRIGRPNPQGARSWLGVMVDRLVQQNRGEGLIVPDDKVAAFDHRVMRPLKQHSPAVYEALEAYYMDSDLTVAKLAKRLRVRKQTASDLLRSGRDMVSNVIEAKC